MGIDRADFADKLACQLECLIANVPERFYDSFDFTRTGSNLTHPVTLGLLCRILWGMQFPRVAIDWRLNLGNRTKFQPDLVCLTSDHSPTVFVDYESPNSSDARIPTKDVDAYLSLPSNCRQGVPYVIITTLPNKQCSKWELRYTSQGQYNEGFRDQRKAIRQNPFCFWMNFYLSEFTKRQMDGIAMLNIDGKSVQRVYPSREGDSCHGLCPNS